MPMSFLVDRPDTAAPPWCDEFRLVAQRIFEGEVDASDHEGRLVSNYADDSELLYRRLGLIIDRLQDVRAAMRISVMPVAAPLSNLADSLGDFVDDAVAQQSDGALAVLVFKEIADPRRTLP